MIAAFPPRRSSFEIRSLIPGAFIIAAADLRNSLLPETVSDVATGRSDKRPASGADNQRRHPGSSPGNGARLEEILADLSP
jgi:hypothetical protein